MNTEILDNQTVPTDNESFSSKTMAELHSLSKWLKMTAILGFIQLPISIITSLNTGNYITLFATVFGVVFTILLFNAANGLQSFCRNPNPFDLARFGGNIRNYYMIPGILCIIGIGIFLLIALFGIIAAL